MLSIPKEGLLAKKRKHQRPAADDGAATATADDDVTDGAGGDDDPPLTVGKGVANRIANNPAAKDAPTKRK